VESGPPPVRPSPSRLLERDRALRLVRGACAHARAGRPAIVFLVGNSGLGKTSVLRCARAAAGTLRVGHAVGVVAESGLPYALLATALGHLGAGTLLEPLARGSDPPDSRALRFYAVQRWLQTTPPPCLLALDDLQWADADSLALLGFLGRRLAGLPVAVVATMRPWPSEALGMAEELVHAGVAELERLSPLSETACSRLLAQTTGRDPAPDLVQRATSLCRGNPLLIREIALAMLESGSVPRIEGRGTGASFLLARFAGVPPAALRYAQVASVFGARFRAGLVPAVADLTDGEGQQALTALLGAGLLEPAVRGVVSFVHPLFREALYEDLAAPLRSQLHAQALRALVGAGAEPEEAAAHAVSGHLRGDPEAVAVLERAGRGALLSGGAGTAVTHLAHAVELSGTAVPADRLLLLSEALVAAGHSERAMEAAGRALASAPLAKEARVASLRQLGRAAFVAGRLDEASQAFDEAARVARPPGSVLQLEALLDGALTLMTTDPIPLTLRRSEQARRLAGAGSSVHRALADVAWGTTAAICGDPRGVECVRAAAGSAPELLVAATDAAWMWRIHLARAAVARQVEDFDEALAIYARAAPPLESRGAPMPIVGLAIGHCDTLKRLGRLAEAEAILDRMAALVELAPTAAPWLEVARLDMAQERGEEVAHRGRVLAQSLGQDERHRPLLLLWLWSIQGEELTRRGAAAAALPFYRRCRELATRDGIVDPCTVPWTRGAIEAQVAAQAMDEAEATLSWLEANTRPWPCRGPRAVVAYGRGLLASRSGRPESEGWFAEALHQLAATPLPLLHARVLLALGRHRRHDRRAAAARPVLAEAAQVAEQSGAGWLAAAAIDELRASGGRRRVRTDAADGLTGQEQRIARLAADGRSNGEIGSVLFLSPRTVESHLGRIYAKLRVPSRRELGERLDARDP